MKQVLFLTLFLCTLNAALCQNKEKTLTQAELFSTQSGTLIEKRFITIGKVNGIEVQVIKYKDLNSGAEKSALRFEYEYKSSYSSDTKVAVLDMDEIDGLIKSMKNIQENVFPSARENYTEITYHSRSGFEAGTYFSTSQAEWKTYFQLEKYDKNSLVFMSTEKFIELYGLVVLAKGKL